MDTLKPPLEEVKKELLFAYFAGLFDGEGCVRIGKNKPNPLHTSTSHYYLQVLISNQHLPILQEIQTVFGGSIQESIKCYVLHIASRQAASFLKAIKSYSRIKLDEIELALAFQELQNKGALSRSKKSEEYMLLLDGFRLRLSELKQRDKQHFQLEITDTTNEGG